MWNLEKWYKWTCGYSGMCKGGWDKLRDWDIHTHTHTRTHYHM